MDTPLYRYDGQLQDAAGNPLNGAVDLTFRLYRQAEGGRPIWSEAYTGPDAVAVSGGAFHVLLGSRTPLDPAQLLGSLFLEIEVNGETLSPREPFEAGGWAPASCPEANCTCDSLTVNLNANLTDGNITEVNRIQGDQEYIDFLTGANAARGIRVGELGIDSVYSNADSKLDALGGNSLWVKDKLQTGSSLTVGGAVTINGTGQSIVTNPLDVTVSGAALRFGQDSTWLGIDDNEIATYGGALNLQASGATERVVIHTSLDVDGPASINGTLDMLGHGIANCGALVEANLQTPAELAAGKSERFEEGDLLCWGLDRLERCTVAGDRLVQAVADAQGRPIVLGAEVVKVLGPVRRGDILVASEVPGYARVDNDPAPGSAIAQALVDFEGDRGLIKAMIRKF
jgi:hypothetical protein